jgi:hypothetical protein
MLLNSRPLFACACCAVLLSLGGCSAFKNDQPQQGLLPNGSRYEGNLVEGLLNGKGKLFGADGSRYEGEFRQGIFAGTGEAVFATGDSYKGEFSNGLPNGSGSFNFANGSRYDGEIKNGNMHGKGIYISAEGDRYEGIFTDGVLDGEAIFTGKNKSAYKGEFKNWVFDGKGDLTNADGTRYSGDFRNGEFDGKGMFSEVGGNQYRGEFSLGRYHGKGSYTYAKPVNGISSFNGIWRNGQIVEADKPGIIFDSAALVETALYNQIELIDAQLVKIDTERSNNIDVFFVGIAGDGNQDVFLRELNTVREVMAEKFNAGNRQILLANNRNTANQLPMATLKSLDYTLEAVGQMMGDEDILFLYMSSHGSKPEDNKDTEFLLSQTGMMLNNVSPAALKTILDKHHLPYQIVIISACYSGGFIPTLKADNRLVMTSAAANKQSFGCSDEENMTYFGEAFFQQGLNQTSDLNKAFQIAKRRVSKRESSKNFEPSEPQLYKAPDVIPQWQKLLDEMGKTSAP